MCPLLPHHKPGTLPKQPGEPVQREEGAHCWQWAQGKPSSPSCVFRGKTTAEVPKV